MLQIFIPLFIVFYVVLYIFKYIYFYCTGYFSEVACPWKRPPVTVYQYNAHTHGHGKKQGLWVRVRVFNATFNNISVISCRSVLLLEETRVPGENPPTCSKSLTTLSHNIASNTPRLSGIRTHNVSQGHAKKCDVQILIIY